MFVCENEKKKNTMDRLLNELEEYLSSNTIQHSLDKENYTVSFEGKSYEVFEPNEDGYFFSEDFRWDCERTEEDGYIFRLGGVWYTLDKGKENEPKLNRVKWRGQSEMAGLSTNFLGVHGSFELLNGTGLYPDWAKKAKFLGIERLGIVEKATLAGALKFQNACKAEGIIPVFGLEVPVKDEKKDIVYTYKIYTKNEKGWQHLLALNKVLNCDDSGKFVSPKDMSEHVSDVYIVFDPKTIQFEDVPILLRSKPNVFWQVDTVEYTKNDRDTSYLMNFEKFYKSKMKPVAIFDAYYIEPEYAILREVVNKIDGKVNYKSGNQYFKDEATYMEELLSLFGDSEKGEEFYMIARSNADMIAENCNFEIPTDSRHLPRYEMATEEKKKYASNEDMFDSLIYEGLENKPELLEDYSEDVLVERIERESDVIKYGQVVDYFLILRDIVNWCKKNNILLGGGRGSSSGSLISYLFGLVNTNPLHFGLIFERFLNKGRVLSSLPDIDTDVPGEYRPAVKQYMENRFGASQVCSVGTYTTLQIKQAINDVGKIYGASIPTLRRLTKMIEDVKTEEDFLKLACKRPEINQFLNKYPEMMNVVFLLLGQQKAASIHACAMMIFPKEKTMYEWCPVRKSGDLVVSEWEGGEMDEAGFLKEDILGIEQLDKFTDILNLIEKNTGRKINLYSDIEYDDPEVYRYFANGWLSDIFQFSAKGLCAYTQKLKPKNMDDVVAALSLFRPGPMENGFHMDYIALKNGEKEPEYPIGAEEILKNTYSVMCVSSEMDVKTSKGVKKIKDICVGEYVQTEDGSYQKVLDKFNNGIKNTIKIVTSFGGELRVTADHKILTSDGWKEASNLKRGDFIKAYWMQDQIPVEEENEDSLKNWMIGFFIAEGRCSSTPYFTVGSIEVVQFLKLVIEKVLPFCFVNVTKHERITENNVLACSWRVYVKGSKGKENGYFSSGFVKNPLIALLKEEGLWGKNCYNKELPTSCTIDTLSGILEGDGGLSSSTLNMCNDKLVRQIYYKLQSYGIYCHISHRQDGYPCLNWSDVQNKLRFRFKSSTHMNYLGKRGFQIPSNQFLKIPKDRVENYCNWENLNKSLRHTKAIKAGNVYKNNIEDLVKHLFWGKVLNVKNYGEEEVYDLKVENNHSFVCEGLVVHNCYQEQIMNICNQLADFDLVTCDKVRKSLGKKKLDVLLPLKTKFIEGYVGKFGSKGVTEKNAEILWEQMEEFAKYSFNKCVSFRTLVYVVGLGEITVERLFHVFYNQECNSFMAKSMKQNGSLYFSKIKDVRYSGNRPVYEISLVDGKKIRTTGNHKFPTTEGKVYAEFLMGKTLFVANDSSNAQMANVISVRFVGNEDVYDIEMEDENHNFVANGIVTCNSHAAAYAINAYNSLWLKVHYPLEFWSVALSRASEDDFPQYVNEMQQTEGIEIKPVNINKSDINIVADKKDNSIYWAINATKQVGEKAQNQIMEERSKNGEYFSLAEFIDRHTFKGSAVNKSVIENLIYSGAFDMMDETREFSNIFSAREFMLGKYREKNKIKIDKEKDEYFLAFEKKKIAKDWWWLLQQKNKSGFAFFDYEGLVREYLKPKVRNGVFYNVEDLQNYDGSTYEMVMVGGYVLEVEEREGKKGRFANLLLESNYKFLRVVIFPDDYEENADFFLSSKKSILLLSGKANFDKFKEEYVLQVNSNSKFIKLGV